MTLVSSVMRPPALSSPQGFGRVEIKLRSGAAPGFISTGEVLGTSVVTADPTTGAWSVDLVPNANITPANTYYEIRQSWPGSTEPPAVSWIQVPASGGPYTLGQLLVVPPTSTGPVGISAISVQMNGVTDAQRAILNLIAGAGMVINVADNPATGAADVTLQSSGVAPVTSVAGKTGAVTLVKGDVGLGNVDNTSDANKPVSTATATALASNYLPALDVFGPMDQGALAWNFDPAAIAGAFITLASGSVLIAKIPWRSTRQITGVLVGLQAGSGLTAGQSLVGVYSSAGVLLGQTADQSADWVVTGLKRIALTAPITPAGGANGFLWVAVMSTGTTPPTWWRGSSTPSTDAMSLGSSLATSRWGIAATAQTSLQNFNPANIVRTGNTPLWAALY